MVEKRKVEIEDAIAYKNSKTGELDRDEDKNNHNLSHLYLNIQVDNISFFILMRKCIYTSIYEIISKI